MSRLTIAMRLAFSLFIGVLVLMCSLAEEGCSAQQLREATSEATYLGQQLQCVDRAPTREAADACRKEVLRRWGIDETVTKDAGDDHE